MDENNEYYAFISYKREDEKWAKWLQHKLEHYRFPTNLNGRTDLPKNIRPTFRDVTDLEPGFLAEKIDTALRNSLWLIVICSPRSAKSPWVCKEAQTFINLGRDDHIIPFVIEGNPFSDDIANECYPEALRNLIGSKEILAANINEMGRDAAAIKIVSRMFGLRFDTLWQRHEREKRRRRNWIISIVSIFVISIIIISIFIVQQNRRLKQTTSRAASSIAEQLIEDGDSYLARKIALEALRLSYTNEAANALYHTIYHNTAIFRTTTGGYISRVALSADGEKVIAFSSAVDANIQVWDRYSGQCIDRIACSLGSTYDIRFCPKNNRIQIVSDGIINGGWQSILCIRTINSNSIDTLKGHINDITSVSYNNDGRYIVSASLDNTIRIWDATSKQCIDTLNGHNSFIHTVKYSPNNQLIVSAEGNTLYVRNVITKKCLHVLTGHKDYVHTVVFSPDGTQIVSGSNDNTLRIWDVISGLCIDTLIGHNGKICSVNYSQDGLHIVSSSNDSTIRVWDANSGYCEQILRGHKGWVNTAVFTHDGKQIVSASTDGTIRIWDMNKEKQSQEMNLCHYFEKSPQYATYSPDGKKIATFFYDNIICIWDIASRKCIDTLIHNSWKNGPKREKIEAIAYSPDGKHILSTTSRNIRVWNTFTRKCLYLLDNEKCGEYPSVSFSPDGKKFVSSSSDGIIRLWNTESGQCIDSFPSQDTRDVYYTPDGKHIITVSNHIIHFWDVKTKRCVRKIKTSYTYILAISPDGKYFATEGNGNIINIFNIKLGMVVRKLKGHTSTVTSVSFSPDNKRLVSSSWDGTIRIWDSFVGWKPIVILNSPYNINWTSFSPNGRQIVSASTDGTIKIWDYPPLQEVINKTHKQFRSNPLTIEERQQYYLDTKVGIIPIGH